MNLWSTGDGSNDDVGSLRNALPSDLDAEVSHESFAAKQFMSPSQKNLIVSRAFRQYRSTSYIYSPAMLDLGNFE